MDNVTIQQKVADEIKKSGTTVENIVVAKLVEVETVKRTELIIKGLETLNKTKKEFTKINKPDQENFTSPGVKGTGTYSAARNEEIIKSTATIKKLSEAIDLALDKNDGESYGKLADLLK